METNLVPDVAGYVDIFDTTSILVRHLADQGLLSSPEGMAVAPATFQNAARDLLVGNYGRLYRDRD